MKINKYLKVLIIFSMGILAGILFMYFRTGREAQTSPSTAQGTSRTKEAVTPAPEPDRPAGDSSADTPSPCQEWSDASIYNGGDKVIYENRIYRAKWWTQGETPGAADVWEDTLETPADFSLPDAVQPSVPAKTEMAKTGDFLIVGYYPSWKPEKADTIRYGLLTDIIYAFAIPTADGSLLPLDNADTAQEIIRKAHENNVRVSIAIGGWSYNDIPLENTFLAATDSGDKIEKFAGAILSMCRQYGFDGVDMDWEHPRADGSSSAQYEALMLTLADQLHAEGKLLTSAVVSGATADGNLYYDAAAHTGSVLEAVDRIHVMAYDGGDGERHSSYRFAVNCGEYWKTMRNVPPEKIILGVPFYSRPGWASYADLVASNPDASLTDHTDYNGMDVYYNGLETIRSKTAYARDSLGGIMIWELTQDSAVDDLSLLTAIYDKSREE